MAGPRVRNRWHVSEGFPSSRKRIRGCVCDVSRAAIASPSARPAVAPYQLNNYCKRNGFLLNLSSGMQTVIQVIATGTGSLRNKIMTDPQLRRFDLIPTEHQRPGRPHGWAKIHSETAHGAINLEWHGRSRTLICRVVTKLGNK